MAQNTAPLISFETNGSAPVLRYDIPEPTSYEGKNFIELNFDGDIFTPAATPMPFATAMAALKLKPAAQIREHFERGLRTGSVKGRVRAPRLLGASAVRDGAGVNAGSGSGAPTVMAMLEDGPIGFQEQSIFTLVDEFMQGNNVSVGETVGGDETVVVSPETVVPDPHLYLIETLRLTSYVGDYGAGRIVKTFTLLPGETTKVSIKTYRQRESTSKSASSVLDSLTSESASDLESSLLSEQSNQEKFQKTNEYYADAEASARWGWGSASVKAGVKGSTNAAREEAVKNVSNATQKHSSRASAKREVEVNTSYEVTEKEGEEISIERQIENINRSRTLNFVFRQMNQEFVTLLHLTDIRLGFFNGDRQSRYEVPISAMDELLARYVQDGRRDEVRAAILDQLSGIRDRAGSVVDVLKTIDLGGGDTYRQFDPDLEAQFVDRQGRTHTVKGVLLKADTLVMRTEGVMVESLLGNGPALDDYAAELQQLEIQRREAEVTLKTAEADLARLVNQAIQDGDAQRAAIAEKLLQAARTVAAAGTTGQPHP